MISASIITMQDLEEREEMTLLETQCFFRGKRIYIESSGNKTNDWNTLKSFNKILRGSLGVTTF